jgi:hypothetical protein
MLQFGECSTCAKSGQHASTKYKKYPHTAVLSDHKQASEHEKSRDCNSAMANSIKCHIDGGKICSGRAGKEAYGVCGICQSRCVLSLQALLAGQFRHGFDSLGQC